MKDIEQSRRRFLKATGLTAEEGFNRWTINGVSFPMGGEMSPASFHVRQGKRYRLRMHNASDDIHPVHLHRHSFELTNVAGKPTAGILKDVEGLRGEKFGATIATRQ